MRKKDIVRFKQLEMLEPEFSFDDVTILQSDGLYKEVCRIMKKDGAHDWVIRSGLVLSHPMGTSQLELQFTHDGKVQVMKIRPSSGDYLENADVRILKRWAVGVKGWKCIEPSERVIREMPEFWRYMYKSSIVDSDVLEKRYGKRNKIPKEVEEIDE